MEIWKEIKNYEGLYEVSNLRNVKKLKSELVTKNGIVKVYQEKMMSKILFEGHQYVSLTKNGKTRRIKVARLVGIAFIDNPLEKTTINHKNFNRQDNRVENLEWMSQRDIAERFGGFVDKKQYKKLSGKVKYSSELTKNDIEFINNNKISDSVERYGLRESMIKIIRVGAYKGITI